MLCYAILYSVILFYAVLCYAMLYTLNLYLCSLYILYYAIYTYSGPSKEDGKNRTAFARALMEAAPVGAFKQWPLMSPFRLVSEHKIQVGIYYISY